MPRGDKSSYTEKQKRMAEHIEESAEARGATEDEAERIAWATVNKYTGGGGKKKSTKTIKEMKPEAKTKKVPSVRTGPAKTTGSKRAKLSAAGRKGAAAAARSVNRTSVKKRAAAKKASMASARKRSGAASATRRTSSTARSTAPSGTASARRSTTTRGRATSRSRSRK